MFSKINLAMNIMITILGTFMLAVCDAFVFALASTWVETTVGVLIAIGAVVALVLMIAGDIRNYKFEKEFYED